jgi:hypothetical protein
VQQDADVISAMAEVDEADAMFDDEEEEQRPREMFLGRFASEEYAEAYHRSDRGRRHNVRAPLPGDTYFDTTAEVLRMYVGDRWVPVDNDELADILAPQQERLDETMSGHDWWTGQYSVEINRIRPRYTSDGSVCTGLVATLNQSVDINFIESRFGGGTYDITIRGGLESRGHRRFLRGCRITIAGEPKILGLEPEPATPAPVPPQAKTMLERVIDRKRNPIKPCSDVILSTDKPTRLVEAVEEPDDIDS